LDRVVFLCVYPIVYNSATAKEKGSVGIIRTELEGQKRGAEGGEIEEGEGSPAD